MNGKITKKEFAGYSRRRSKIMKKIEEIAPLCTNIFSREQIEDFEADDRLETMQIYVWSSECGHDSYQFPFKYLSMTPEQVKTEEAARKKKKRRPERETVPLHGKEKPGTDSR